MSKNIFDLRFGIKRPDGYTSSVWRLWSTRHGDVYLAVRRMAGIEKYSFHRSGLCRSAFTKEYGRPAKLSDRVVHKWRRSPTPPTVERAARVALIAFPTDFLSRDVRQDRKQVTWIDAAPCGGATYVELGFSRGPEVEVRDLLAKGGNRSLLSFAPLPSGETLLLTFYYADWDNRELRSPAAPESVFPDLLFSPDDPDDTGRPIRILFGPKPADGGAVVLRELGGYVVARPGDAGVD